jgi:hypothetical protein
MNFHSRGLISGKGRVIMSASMNIFRYFHGGIKGNQKNAVSEFPVVLLRFEARTIWIHSRCATYSTVAFDHSTELYLRAPYTSWCGVNYFQCCRRIPNAAGVSQSHNVHRAAGHVTSMLQSPQSRELLQATKGSGVWWRVRWRKLFLLSALASRRSQIRLLAVLSWEQNAPSVVFCLSWATFRKFSLSCRYLASTTPPIHFCSRSIPSRLQKIQFLLQVSRLRNIAGSVPFSVYHEETVVKDFLPSYQTQRTF